MATYSQSPLAEDDLFEIITTTIEAWGEQQAKIYAQNIDVALLRLAEYPSIGRERNEVYKGSRSFPVEKHIVFYELSGISVARILHQRMDSSKYI